MNDTPINHYLLASDFDQTLSFKDSGPDRMIYVRELFESYGLTLNGWEKDRTDRVTIGEMLPHGARAQAAAV
jgi:hypothetical protein